MNNTNLLNKLHQNNDQGNQTMNLHQRANLTKTGVERGDNFIIFKRQPPKRKRFNETRRYVKGSRRALSCGGVEKPKAVNPAQEHQSPSIKHNADIKRPCMTPSHHRALSIVSKDEKMSRVIEARHPTSTLNKSVVHSRLMSRVGSPVQEPKKFNCIIRVDKQKRKPLQDVHVEHDEVEQNEIMRDVEDKIRGKFADDLQNNDQRIKRFKQLQEYLKMANREVRINQKIRNESKRIVKGEIPLGTDTQIKHEVRENYPGILEIKRKLKNCLAIECPFDEVIKYANEYFGIRAKNEMIKEAYQKRRAQVIFSLLAKLFRNNL